MNIIIGTVVILGSGLLCALLDLQKILEQRAWYWAIGVFAGIAGGALLYPH